MVTKRHLEELGYKVTREPYRQAICEGMGIQTMVRTDQACNVEVHVRARCRGEEANDSCLCHHEVEQSRLDDKAPYLRSAHERMRNAGSETQQRQGKTRRKACEAM